MKSLPRPNSRRNAVQGFAMHTDVLSRCHLQLLHYCWSVAASDHCWIAAASGMSRRCCRRKSMSRCQCCRGSATEDVAMGLRACEPAALLIARILSKQLWRLHRENWGCQVPASCRSNSYQELVSGAMRGSQEGNLSFIWSNAERLYAQAMLKSKIGRSQSTLACL